VANRNPSEDRAQPAGPPYVDPLEPREFTSHAPEGDVQWVLVPVSAADYARRKRRIKVAAAIFCLAVLALAVWFYKRQVDPVRALEAFDAGERLFRTARYEEAILSFDRAISLKQDFADAYLLRGRAYMNQEKPALAIADFSRVIQLRPQDPEAYLERGLAHLSIEERSAALTDFTTATELAPRLARAFNYRGTALRALGRLREALADFHKAVELDPNADNLFQRGATYQAIGDHEFAIQDFSAVIRILPSSPQAYFARAQSFRALGDFASAQRDHDTGRRLDGR
jgi:tetratricopeptide (TPR) repeat protein